ncbi:hypothetical protein Pla100_28180 [Neorhodopirellula pilleata]|uniref:Uncharacterized protein n=1 Tax=Neorhodopirellula pilleata TaxID=2714738 RepID=A0A5C6ABB5_9BACT|nr:hypothetical protein Pla100_28180 [Neorhodopirellula pilleata]
MPTWAITTPLGSIVYRRAKRTIEATQYVRRELELGITD